MATGGLLIGIAGFMLTIPAYMSGLEWPLYGAGVCLAINAFMWATL
jgi:hypothetical protein